MTLLETIEYLTKISKENPELNNEVLNLYVENIDHVFDLESIKLRFVDQDRDCTLELDEKEGVEDDCENGFCSCLDFERNDHRNFKQRIVIYGVEDLEKHKTIRLNNE